MVTTYETQGGIITFNIRRGERQEWRKFSHFLFKKPVHYFLNVQFNSHQDRLSPCAIPGTIVSRPSPSLHQTFCFLHRLFSIFLHKALLVIITLGLFWKSNKLLLMRHLEKNFSSMFGITTNSLVTDALRFHTRSESVTVYRIETSLQMFDTQ